MDYNNQYYDNSNQVSNNQVNTVIQPTPVNQSDNLIKVEKKSNKGSVNFLLVYVITIVTSLAIGAIGMVMFLNCYPDFFEKNEIVTTNVTKTEKEVTVTDTGIADAVEKIYDSVVVVKTYVKDKLYSTGTGFVYKKDGNKYYLITNYHVIQDGTKISVVFTDGTEAVVNVEGGDKYSDIAVLSYETSNELAVAEIGSSTDMRVGDTVFAIGAPLDSNVYSWSVTRGVLSGKDREVEVSISNSSTSDWIMLVLQTDAAINSGNSGGPLCNSNGQVIGITNMKLVTDGVEGMGFAIPIEEAANYADQIINGEDVSRPYLGIQMVDASIEGYAGQYGVTATEGVLIGSVEKGSPAEKAGLQSADVIVGLNNATITGVASLRYELYKYKSGEEITITYLRNGNKQTTKLTLSSQ